MNIKTAFKYIFGIVATVILGAIGSGLWERVFSPILDSLYRSSVNLISSISLDYKDGIYESAAMGFTENFSFRIFVLLSMLCVFFLLFFVARINFFVRLFWGHISNRNFDEVKILSQFIVLTLVFYVIYNLGRLEVVQNTKAYSSVSLEILRPHIGDDYFLMLRSDYLQIRTANDFYLFNEKVIIESQKYKVILPKFNPI